MGEGERKSCGVDWNERHQLKLISLSHTEFTAPSPERTWGNGPQEQRGLLSRFPSTSDRYQEEWPIPGPGQGTRRRLAHVDPARTKVLRTMVGIWQEDRNRLGSYLLRLGQSEPQNYSLACNPCPP